MKTPFGARIAKMRWGHITHIIFRILITPSALTGRSRSLTGKLSFLTNSSKPGKLMNSGKCSSLRRKWEIAEFMIYRGRSLQSLAAMNFRDKNLRGEIMNYEKVAWAVRRKAAGNSSGQFAPNEFTLSIFAEEFNSEGQCIAPSVIRATAPDGSVYETPLNRVFAQGR